MADELFNELNRLANSTFALKGTFLFRREEASSSVYAVRSGKVAQVSSPIAEEKTPMEMLRPGRVIGLAAAMNGTYSAAAKKIADSEL